MVCDSHIKSVIIRLTFGVIDAGSHRVRVGLVIKVSWNVVSVKEFLPV